MHGYIEKVTAQWVSEAAKLPHIPLWDNEQESVPSIIPFLSPGAEKKAAMIICAGGAYMWKEPLEAFPHAHWLNGIGVHAFVLDYRVKPGGAYDALQDAQRAIRMLRHRRDDWRINSDKIGLIGFSSGGHLAAMASTHFDLGNPDATDPIERVSCRPDAQVLCYPHITYTPYIKDDPEFMVKFFGVGYTQADVDKLNVHLLVRRDTPAAFIWGMQGDWQFGQGQFQLYVEALDKRAIMCSYHIFPGGSHNEGRDSTSPIWKQWTMLCECWLSSLAFR